MATIPVFSDVPAWPEPATTPPPAGHNRPPLSELIPMEFREELTRDNPEFLTRLADLVEAADRAKATNDDELGRCGNLVNGYRKLISAINEAHKTVKAPYLEGGRLVDAEKNELIGQVETAKRRVEAVGNAYVADRDAKQRAENERLAAIQRAAAEAAAQAEQEREDAERRAAAAIAAAASDDERQAAERAAAEAAARAEEAMSAAALAPAAPVKAEPVRSDEGAAVSGKQEWKSEVTDYQIAFMHVEDHPKVREAIDKAVAQLVKAGGKRKLDGVRIWPVAKANFR